MSVGRGFYTPRDCDILLRVNAKPGARRDRVAGIRADGLVVEVRAAPERGRANDAVTRVLADALGVRSCEIVLKLGAASPRKVFTLPLAARGALERLEKGMR